MIDRRALMRAAHRGWRYVKMKGWHLDADDPWTFGRCLKLEWARAKIIAAREREQPDEGFFLTEIKDLAAWREEAKTDPYHGLTVVLSDGTRMLAKDVPDD